MIQQPTNKRALAKNLQSQPIIYIFSSPPHMCLYPYTYHYYCQLHFLSVLRKGSYLFLPLSTYHMQLTSSLSLSPCTWCVTFFSLFIISASEACINSYAGALRGRSPDTMSGTGMSSILSTHTLIDTYYLLFFFFFFKLIFFFSCTLQLYTHFYIR